VFSVDNNTGSVAHVNFVSASLRAKGVDAREWAASVITHIGGKVNWVSLNIGGFADQRPRLVVKKRAHKESGQRARRSTKLYLLHRSTCQLISKLIGLPTYTIVDTVYL
jgi:hypothetical protein